jgi:hypothetical protein
LVEYLGRGQFGEVWRARDDNGKEVALKFIRCMTSPEQTEVAELDRMKNLGHPHLLVLHRYWRLDGWLAVALEVAQGTLDDLSRRAPIPLPQLLEYFREAAKGLDYLHAQGLQHRDVKPANLLLVGGGVKVADFGLVKLLAATVATNTNRNIAGTPAFAASEVWQAKTSRHSDQYALAVSYCQLRGGRLPFRGEDPMAMAWAHCCCEPDLSMLPPPERPAVARALAKKPEQRWPSCRAFVEAVAASAVGARPRMTYTVDRRRILAGVLAATVALAVSGTGPMQPPHETAPEPVASLQVCSLDQVKVRPGEQATLAVRVRRENLPGRVDLELNGLPPGVTAAPGHLEAGASEALFTLTADATAEPVDRDVSVTARSGHLEYTALFHLAVAPAVVTQQLQVERLDAVTLRAGGQATLAVRVRRQNVPGRIELELVGLPPGVTAAPDHLEADDAYTRLTLTADVAAAPEERDVKLVVRAGSVTHEGSFRLRLASAPRTELLALNDNKGRRAAFAADGRNAAFILSPPNDNVLATGPLLASGAGDRRDDTISVLAPIEHLCDQTSHVDAVGLFPDGRRLLAATVCCSNEPRRGDARRTKYYTLVCREPNGAVELTKGPRFERGPGIHCLAFSPDGSEVLIAGPFPQIYRWKPGCPDFLDRTRFFRHGAGDAVTSLAYASGGCRLAASAGLDKLVCLYDTAKSSPDPVATLRGLDTSAQSVALSADGKHVLAGGSQGKACLWELGKDATAAKSAQVLQWHDQATAVRAVTFTPDGQYFLTGCDDGTVCLGRVGRDKPVWVQGPRPGGGKVLALAVAADDRQVQYVQVADESGLYSYPLVREVVASSTPVAAQAAPDTQVAVK